MLTCPQILTQATRFCDAITADNYHLIATLIHPQCDWNAPHSQDAIHSSPALTAIYNALRQLPEVAELVRALDYRTTDYSDLLIRAVTLWQANAAKARWWTDNVINQEQKHPTSEDASPTVFPNATFSQHVAHQRARRRTGCATNATLWPGDQPHTAATPPRTPPSDTAGEQAVKSTDTYHLTLTYTDPNDSLISLFTFTAPSRTTTDTLAEATINFLASNTWKISTAHKIHKLDLDRGVLWARPTTKANPKDQPEADIELPF